MRALLAGPHAAAISARDHSLRSDAANGPQTAAHLVGLERFELSTYRPPVS
jgi:hypothetical protein